MDISGAYVSFRQASTIASVQMAVAKKMLDSQRLQGNAALKLLEAASGTASKAGDQLVAAAIGLGAAVDVYG